MLVQYKLDSRPSLGHSRWKHLRNVPALAALGVIAALILVGVQVARAGDLGPNYDHLYTANPTVSAKIEPALGVRVDEGSIAVYTLTVKDKDTRGTGSLGNPPFYEDGDPTIWLPSRHYHER